MNLISMHALNFTKLLKNKKIKLQCLLPRATSATVLEEEAAAVAPAGARHGGEARSLQAGAASVPVAQAARDGVWSVLTAELVSGQSCRDGAGAGSCRTARR